VLRTINFFSVSLYLWEVLQNMEQLKLTLSLFFSFSDSSSWFHRDSIHSPLFYTLCAAYSLISFIALIQLIRIELRVPEYGWTTQKIFHLFNFIVSGGEVHYLCLYGFYFQLYALFVILAFFFYICLFILQYVLLCLDFMLKCFSCILRLVSLLWVLNVQLHFELLSVIIDSKCVWLWFYYGENWFWSNWFLEIDFLVKINVK